MQPLSKWLPVSAAVLGVALLIGGVYCAQHAITSLHINRAEAATGSSWPSWSQPATATVPILSAGTPGVRLGLAQVTGPKTVIGRVRAVLQIDGDFHDVRAKILVPSDSYTSLRRVQGTAVTAVVQYELLNFKSNHKATHVTTTPVPRDRVVYVPVCPECGKRLKDGERHHHHGNRGNHYGWQNNKHRDDD